MSLSASVSTQIPTNVVEVGNEISQNAINAIAASSSPSTVNPMMTSGAVSATYAPKASPTFTGTVTIPAGASIAGYATQSYVTSQGYITDAPSNGNQYARQNGAWAVVTGGGGGGGSVAWGGITGTVTDQTDLTGYIGGLGYQTSSDVSTYVTGLGYIGDAPSNGSEYVRKNGAWSVSSGLVKTVNTIGASASYTLAAGDETKIHWLSGGMSGSTLVVPDDSTYNFAIGTELTVVCDDNGSSSTQITSSLMGTPTINGATVPNTSIVKVGHLVKVASNTWLYS